VFYYEAVIKYKIQILNSREDLCTELGNDTMKALETKRQSDAKAIQQAFDMNKKVKIFCDSGVFGFFTVHYLILMMKASLIFFLFLICLGFCILKFKYEA